MAQIGVSNISTFTSIDDVYFNGVLAPCTSGCPNTPGNSSSYSASTTGTYTLDVNYSWVSSGGGNVIVTDSYGNKWCLPTSSTPGTLTFVGVTYDGLSDVNIEVGDAPSCSSFSNGTFSMSYSLIDEATACFDTPSGTYYTSPGIGLQDGTILYSDISLTTYASNGFYSNGYYGWEIYDGVGTLSNQSSCSSFPTPTPTSNTPTPTQTPTVTETPTATPPCSCTYYDVIVTSNDIDSATGNTTPNWNNTVWVRYYDCTTGAPLDMIFYAADPYYTALCNNNIYGTPYLYNHINDVPNTAGITSTITNTSVCCTVDPTPTPTPDPTPNPTPTQTPSNTATPPIPPSSTPASTPTATPPCSCTYYDVIVTSNDIDSATGNTTTIWNNTVWVRYYDCATGAPLDMIFYAADPYYNTLCNNNIYGAPYLYNHINEVPNTAGITSTITNNLTCCTIDPTPTQTPSNTPTPTPNSTPAVTPTQTSTPASTPGSTPPVTPSPTPTLGSWTMTNTSGDIDISNMTFNTAVTVTSGSFPSTPVSTISGNSELGTNTLTLNTVTTNLPYQFITVIDSNGASQTQPLSPIPFASNVNFPNVFINTTTSIQILVQEVLPTTPTPTPTPVYYQLNVFSGLTNDDACQETYPATVYSLYSSLLLTLNNAGYLYQDSSLIVVVDPYAIFADGTGYCFLLDLTSQVVDNPLCAVGPYTPTPTNTETPTQTPSETSTQTPTPTNTETPTQTPTPSVTIGLTPTQTPTNTETPTNTPSETPTNTPTNTETPTNTPSETPTNTPTNTETPTNTPSETPTNTPSETPTNTPTNTETPTQTPTETPTETPTQTPTNTETPTQTPTETPTQTPSQTPSNTGTPTQTQTNTQTQTQTPTQTNTQTQTTTPTNTPTPTLTPTVTQTPGLTTQFQDCSDGVIFRFHNGALPTTTGFTYNITGGNDFVGCATIVPNTGQGPLYDGTGVIFTQTSGCGDPVCPRTSQSPASLSNCSTGAVIYFNVDTDTAYFGAVYLYNGQCYSFVEFSGPGGDYVPGPSYSRCVDCIPVPVTPTPYPSPYPTPSPSSTPAPCSTTYCFSTTDSTLSGYSGNYTLTGSYDGRSTFSGDGTSVGFIYYNNTSWCLSTSVPGTCLYQGASPCYFSCPDFPSNVFYSGPCVTPTPTPVNCSIFDFNAYFDCDWEPIPTPTPTVPCDDVNFDLLTIGVTPTPSTSKSCSGKSVVFSLSGFTTPITPTPSNTPTITLTRTVNISNSVNFPILDETFSCVTTKVLIDCNTGDEIYVNSGLVLSGTSAQIGMTILTIIDGTYKCVIYDRDDSNLSSNADIDEVLAFYNECGYCNVVPTPTPTVTPSPTSTNTPTPSVTATNTPTPTLTPSQTATNGTTPPPTPTATTTMTPTNSATHTMTPTPSVTPNYVYVYESCSPISYGSPLNTQVIQNEKVSFTNVEGTIFKDSVGNCWNYQGRFDADYIAPPTVNAVTYEGNYFSGGPTTVYPTCADCQVVPVFTCNYVYFNASRCDNGQNVVVAACDLGQGTALNSGGFDLGTILLTPVVGQTHSISVTNGDDYCVILNSTTTSVSNPAIIATPAWANYTCSTCPIYKTYYANACDGSAQNVLIYAPANSTTLSVGAAVTVDINSTCYTIISYEGIQTEIYLLPGVTPQLSQSFITCQECFDAVANQGGGGGGDTGGGGSSS